MDSFRTEEEQVEAIRRWWDENGRSTLVTIVLVLVAVFGWQGWQRYSDERTATASDVYQRMLEAASAAGQGTQATTELERLAGVLRSDFGGTVYARFAALHLASAAVAEDDLETAETELRWVLGKASTGSEIAAVAQLRLARVLAAAGETGQALGLLEEGGNGDYRAAYLLARGDVLAAAERNEEALEAYREAEAVVQAYPAQLNVETLQAKLQSLASPAPASSKGES
ncbi:hypothetical protein CWI75_16000 [Kineobactrum sediminis]|uniref:Ancillary SecYEG translocon subunit n=1 Tax=Kineobactrum sediminis TaxID=1905677 RepID=A0A2N5XYW3_9GAMM|nr:tetratricopeptide repeat protein [Kineobactrum sediminis]PLW81335.1 hypothetical protein CWI75_16000 [Kineobactrum sediminis]